MPSDPARARSLFNELCDLDAAARAHRLDEACQGDAELRAEVEALLANDPGKTTDLVEPPLTVGRSVGPYRLLQRIGEGGMGIVYLAERDEPFKRVALKVIKPDMDSAQVLARFEAERQALALMNHPNVATFLDAGVTEEGYPYFVMEHVAGVAITQHCDDRRLGLTERLELFEQVCRGVHHAHQKGVIHRDIKPSNVLVEYQDEVATPKIIDFGVAKALQQPLTRRPLFTLRGQLVGTPEYMSPEQVRLDAQDIDTRSDVYSLGVLLYELLTGALPFDRESLRAAGIEGMFRLIRETDPPRPSTRLATLERSDPEESTEAARLRRTEPRTLARRLRDDLDWITMMCLEKDRARRYESAAALADDVRRHIEHRVVRARPPSLGYRSVKLWRRNRGAIVASAAVAVVALVGLVVATGLVVSNRTKQVEIDQRRARDLVERARLLGYGAPDEAAELLDQAVALDPTLEAAEIERVHVDRRRRRSEEAIARARAVLEHNPASGEAAALLAGLLKRTNEAASRRYAAMAEAQLEAGELYAALAMAEPDPVEAIRLLTRSLEVNPWNFGAVWQRATRRFDAGELDGALADAELLTRVRPDLALVWLLHGGIRLAQQQWASAEESLDRALKLDPNGWMLHLNRALLFRHTARMEAALESIDRAVASAPEQVDLHLTRASILEQMGRPVEAIAAFDAAIERGAEGWGLRWDLAADCWDVHDYARAQQEFARALELLPEDAEHEGDRRKLLLGRVETSLALRDFDAAAADLQAALPLGPETAKSVVLQARLLRLQERYAEAFPLFERAAQLSGGQPIYRVEHGVARWRAGELEAALAEFEPITRSEHPDAERIRLWIWEIHSHRGSTAAAAAELDAVSAACTDPLLLEAVRVLRGQADSASLLALAQAPTDRLQAHYTLGARALLAGEVESATDAFTRLIELGLRHHLEHELAEWRLRELRRRRRSAGLPSSLAREFRRRCRRRIAPLEPGRAVRGATVVVERTQTELEREEERAITVRESRDARIDVAMCKPRAEVGLPQPIGSALARRSTECQWPPERDRVVHGLVSAIGCRETAGARQEARIDPESVALGVRPQNPHPQHAQIGSRLGASCVLLSIGGAPPQS